MKKETMVKAVLLMTMVATLTTGCSGVSTVESMPTTEVTTTMEVETETTTQKETSTETESTTQEETSTEAETETTTQEETSTEIEVESTTQEETSAEVETESTTVQEEIFTEVETTTQEETEVEVTTMAVKDESGVSCEDYGEYDDLYEVFILEEGASLDVWKDAFDKYEYVGTDPSIRLKKMDHNGRTIVVFDDTDMENEEDVCESTWLYAIVATGQDELPYGFMYDIDLNIIRVYDNEFVIASEVREGKTWYKLYYGSNSQYWVPAFNAAEWSDIYDEYILAEEQKKLDENPYYNVENYLRTMEHVWNATYYTVDVDPVYGHIWVYVDWVYKLEDGTIDSFYGKDTAHSWHDSSKSYDEIMAKANEIYSNLENEVGEAFVSWISWNDTGAYNSVDLTGCEHDWDVNGDPSLRCRSEEEHISKCH